MFDRIKRATLPIALIPVAFVFGGCGHANDVRTKAETEGLYVQVGDVKYQVQQSRQLNPNEAEDRGYLVALPSAERKLSPNEIWFGVFLRAKNSSSKPQPAANNFEITDTLDHVFRPVAIGQDNLFAYRAGTIPGDELIPEPGSTAAQSPIGGSLLLFKLPLIALQKRPLVLSLSKQGLKPSQAEIDLDV